MENTASEIEVIDIEAYSKAGKTPPKGKKYKIKVDNTVFVVPESLTGREILQIAGKTPVERYQLNQKLSNGSVKKIGYDEVVHFSTPGIEKFMTIPLDQTEG
jgi:hypothetical protein